MTNDELRERIKQNGVIEKLKTLQNQLHSYGISADGPDESRAQDPCLWVHGVSRQFVIQILMPPKAGNSITFNLRPVSKNSHSPKKSEMEAFDAYMTSNGLKTSNHGAFCQLDRKIPLNEIEQVIGHIAVARQMRQ